MLSFQKVLWKPLILLPTRVERPPNAFGDGECSNPDTIPKNRQMILIVLQTARVMHFSKFLENIVYRIFSRVQKVVEKRKDTFADVVKHQ